MAGPLRRSPHGERGLKYDPLGLQPAGGLSLPARGAWVEIGKSIFAGRKVLESLPARGAWVEIFGHFCGLFSRRRRSPHGERGLK